MWVGVAPSSFEVKEAEGGFSRIINHFRIDRTNILESLGHL